jgi:hypothetical protein
VSTVHVNVAGVGSTLPAPSRALTANMCEPFASWVYDWGDLHERHAAPSRLHSKVLDSVAANEKLALVCRVEGGGPAEIVVSGAAVSTVHARRAGVGSRF